MSQLFHRSTNTIARFLIFGSLIAVLGLAWAGAEISRSSYVTQVGVARVQPVPFSHVQHVAGLGIDCRYCHTSVEEGPFAGIPSTHTCMSCHSQIWSDSPELEPVRASYRNDESLRWVRVHDLPDYVYFDHSIHVNKGVGCDTCHGRVDQMPLMWREASLQMEWCLECHREPERYLRPRDQVFNAEWKPPEGDRLAFGQKLVTDYHVQRNLDDCSICHR